MNHFPTKPEHERKGTRARGLARVGLALYRQFEHTGVLSDLEKAIENMQQALSLTPDGHADKPKHLNNLGLFLESRFQHTGVLSDLQEATKNGQEAMSLTPNGHPNKPIYLNTLGGLLKSRFELTGMLGDLEEAIKHQQLALLLTPDDHANKPTLFNNLGNSFGSRFRRTGSLSDLEEAIKHQQHAISLTPDGHAKKTMFLNNLGNSFQGRFRHTGMLRDLEEAIKNQQEAVLLTPDGHPDKPLFLSNLGVSFGGRFQHTGMLSDLDEAIESQQEAVLLTPDDHTDKPMYLSNLGVSFESRFQRVGTLRDLEEAIKYQQKAILFTPDGHVEKPTYINNLGISFESRFQLTGKLSDLEAAIQNQREAVAFTADGHADKPQRLNNLGNFLASRFERTEMLNDLEEAIKNQQSAVSLTPDGHIDKPSYLNNLGISFESRFRHIGLLNDLDEAILNFRLAAISNIGPISTRCRASRQWARLEAKRHSPSALVAYRQTINLLPHAAWIGDPITTRHPQLTDLGGIPREAAAFALDVGHPDLALEWLEQGRSVVWNQLLHLRTSTDHLRQAHPDLDAEFTQISHELQNAAIRGHNTTTPENVVNPISLEEATQHHHRLAEKWDLLVEKIRLLPNFQDFLLPKKVSALTEAANLGPVVVVNVHKRRCDALILSRGTNHVLHIPLDTLRYEDVVKMSEVFKEDLASCGYRGSAPTGRSPRLTGILSKLYSHIVDPILKGLGLTVVPGSDPSFLPRIWWCPTGPLAFLPLHAACRHTGARIEGTFTYAISSYTPTVNALLEARAVERQPFKQIVGIAMTDTPNHPLLPDVEAEIVSIGRLFTGRRCEILRNEQATRDQVLTRMTSNNWIHLACHAVQDEQEPTRSGFCLYDQRLTIVDIIAKQFGYADFAFLSACQTATGDEKASDEAVHITGAMLGTGYRSVIGTMGAIPNEVAPGIATKVYEVLMSGGEPDSGLAAQALHEAVREVRESNHDLYNFWVPFVHYGA